MQILSRAYTISSVWCAGAVVFMLSCGGGEGTLTVTTTPVPGVIIVDGENRGESPVILTLKSGDHEVAFSPPTEQYAAPDMQMVTVPAGETVHIAGEFSNRILSVDTPRGFSLTDSIRYYGTQERKLKDGTIFDYINGGALVYLEHGLRETTHAVFHDTEGSELVIDIFDMEAPENALAAFNNEEICPEGFQSCGLGDGCKSYQYEPDFLVYFHTSRYLVFISTNNDFLTDTVLSYAKAIETNIR